jgi:hypothetical protein
VYGVRHCHPKRKSEHCEAMVKAPDSAEHDFVTGQEASSSEPNASFEPEHGHSVTL